jgi:hypothetical protein
MNAPGPTPSTPGVGGRTVSVAYERGSTYPTNIVCRVRGRTVVVTHPARRAPWWLHLPVGWDGPTPNLRRNSLGGYAFPTRTAATEWVAAQGA